MTEENINVEPEKESVAIPSPKPTPSAPPKVALAGLRPELRERGNEVREAEHKLKEMSRKAKERKAAHNAPKSKTLSETNYFWLVIGGLGALGVGYLVFGKKDPTPKPRQRFKGHRPVAYAYVPPPQPKSPVQPSASGQGPKEGTIEKEEKPAPKFELNCF